MIFTMKKVFLIAATAVIVLACNPQRRLARTILEDSRFDRVDSMARALLATGFNAGAVYNQVWCRDLNTFIETSCDVLPQALIRENILRFYAFQQPNGEMVDGVVEEDKPRLEKFVYYSDLAPGYTGHKNTVETDQESSLILLTAKYIRKTGDRSVLEETVGGKTVLERMEGMVGFILNERFSDDYGLVTGATTVDWGDVQPGPGNIVRIDEYTKWCIDIYDNALFLQALDALDGLLPEPKYRTLRESIAANVRKHLWDSDNQKFIPHIYLDGSPFPDDFDENAICYHGGTAVAIEAGLLSREEIAAVNLRMLRDVEESGMATIGLTVYPPYPEGLFQEPCRRPYNYQNGGDWTWFGARMIRQLVRYGFVREAYDEFSPMIDRVLENNGFYEWYGPCNKPNGSGTYRGEAGVIVSAIEALRAWAAENAN